MAQVLRTVSIELGGNRNGTLLLPDDVVQYFGITVVTTTATARQRRRVGHTRQARTPLAGGTAGTTPTEPRLITVQAATWTDTPSPPERGAGRKIIVPTELKTRKGIIRKVTMRFPGEAVIGAISNFLFTKCTRNKPTMFWTENGKPHLVVAVTGDVNPTPARAPDPTPNP